MSFPRYERYKDSGVECFDEVPEHWNVLPMRRGIKFLTDYEANGSFADTKAMVSLDQGEPYAWYVRGTDLENSRYGFVEENRYCDKKSYEFLDKTKLYGNELLIAKRGEIGKVYLMPSVECPATLAPNLYLLKLNEFLFPEFAYFWFISELGRAQLELSNKSTTIGALYKDDVRELLCTFPPVQEQSTIATFLYHETRKIDELIAEQQRLIELLKEKRQAVISHAVTKGLNPYVTMKNSGVEWLGEVPEHWDVKRLKRLLRLLTEKTDRRDNPIALENIQGWSGRFTPTETEFEGEGTAFERGDILFGKLRPYLAKVYLTESSGEAVGDFHVMRPIPEIYGRFVMHQMLNRDFITIVNSSTFGAKMPRVAWDFMANMALVIPPKNEQQAIIDFLDNEISKFEVLTTEAQTTISLLQERRAALISAAVTGKIDVRGVRNE